MVLFYFTSNFFSRILYSPFTTGDDQHICFNWIDIRAIGSDGQYCVILNVDFNGTVHYLISNQAKPKSVKTTIIYTNKYLNSHSRCGWDHYSCSIQYLQIIFINLTSKC